MTWAGQFMCFAAMGTVGTAVHYGVLLVFVEIWGIRPLIGSVAGFLSGAAVNYILNYYITFQSKKSHGKASIRFFSVAVVGLPINGGIMFVLNELFKLHYIFAQILATLVTLVWNFTGNRLWTFSDQVRPAV